MKTSRALVACLLLVGVAPVWAEGPPEFPGAVPEHDLLKRFVGSWVSESECSTGPDSEPMNNQGEVTSRMLGERWVINEMTIQAGGTEVVGVQTIGYDPAKDKYVGTWVDSMQNHLWVYEGSYDEATKTLTLEAMGPNLMAGGGLIPFRDTYRFVSDDLIESRSEARDDDGEWVTFMTGTMRRNPPDAPDPSGSTDR